MLFIHTSSSSCRTTKRGNSSLKERKVRYWAPASMAFVLQSKVKAYR